MLGICQSINLREQKEPDLYIGLRPKRMICPRPFGMASRKAKKRGRREEFWQSNIDVILMCVTSVHDRGFFLPCFYTHVILCLCYARKLGQGFNYYIIVLCYLSYCSGCLFLSVYTLRSPVFCAIIRMQPLCML